MWTKPELVGSTYNLLWLRLLFASLLPSLTVELLVFPSTLTNQVFTQTSRLEIQVLENSLSTNKLEKQLLLQTQEISKLQERNGSELCLLLAEQIKAK